MHHPRHRVYVSFTLCKRRWSSVILYFPKVRNISQDFQKNGFTLIITISMMVLLAMIAIGMLSLSSISLRSSGAQNAQAVARANARLAMMIALGDLQRTNGIDQSVTMNADLMSAGQSPNPHWIGTTTTVPAMRARDPKQSTIRWLVSGNNPSPNTSLVASSALNQGSGLRIASFREGNQQREILAPVVNINQDHVTGRYAYHVSDEGAKARVNLQRPVAAPRNVQEQIARANSPMENGLININAQDWQKFAPLPVGSISKNNLISMPTVALAAGNPELPRQYVNDVTVGGFGLPVNVDAGGMKADLSLIFDRSQASKNYGTTYFGARGLVASTNGVTNVTFGDPSNPNLFFLSENISRNRQGGVGPNWGNLWNYAIMWQNVASQQMPVVQANPTADADMRFKNWIPYTGHDGGGAFLRDVQHTNSPVTPVISHFQMGFRFNSVIVPGTNPVQYQAQIVIQPVIGIWNPYNVAMSATSFLFEWALYPYFEFAFTTPNNATQQRNQMWLREVWNTGGGPLIPVDVPGMRAGGKYIALQTPAVDLQPGEFRLFSVQSETDMGTSAAPRPLVSGWSERGGYRVNLRTSAGGDLRLAAGSRLWFERIFLQDTQFAETQTRPQFAGLDINKISSVWFGLKSTGAILNRTTEVWNGGNDPSTVGPVTVPEPIIPKANRVKYRIEDVANGTVNPHIGTWAFNLRTTNQVEQPDQAQTLRGWIDSNPRAMVSNSRWDGSNVSNAGRSGWHSASQYIGAFSRPSQGIGDGNGGNRGLLSEAGSAISEPEVNRAGGRYQGYGGAANTLAGGKNHVIVYDVPQAPLTSVGQFQHANLGRYNFDPGFVLGNSYASPRVPLNAIANPNFNGLPGLNMVDLSYDVNRRVWDSAFFSTLGADYINANSSSLNRFFDMKRLASGEQTLTNPRMIFSPLRGDTSVDEIISAAADRAPEAIAARIRIAGAFNVNCTSKNAWKAVLSSMSSSELPVVNPQSGNVSWINNGGIRFNRFGRVLTQARYTTGMAGDSDAFWQGWRSISEAELDQLATEIVNQVRARGPFRSMAEFVNRNPFSTRPAEQLKGPLQAALDRTINASYPSTVGEPSVQPTGAQFSLAINGESSAAGNAAYLQQGDLLQSLAPILQVRSDYFRIRACGEALDASGKVIARAWCEAFVQRGSSYVDSRDVPFRNPTSLTASPNRVFGRKFEIVSFRWLDSNEI